MTGISGLCLDSLLDPFEQPVQTRATNTSNVFLKPRRDCMYENLLTKASLVHGTKSIAGDSWTHESWTRIHLPF